MFAYRYKKMMIMFAVLIALMSMGVFAASASSTIVYTGTIASGAQYDLYPVSIPANTSITATLVCDTTDIVQLDPILSVFNPGSDTSSTSNAELYNDDGGSTTCNGFRSSLINATITVAGIYTFRVDGFGSSTGDYTLTITTTALPQLETAGPPFIPGDDRLNVEAHAPVAIFCTENNAVQVWTINGESHGQLAFTASSTQISAAAPRAPIATGGGATLYKLEDGQLQINATQRDGKGYVFIWNGCPFSRGSSYTIENGVSILTGTFGS